MDHEFLQVAVGSGGPLPLVVVCYLVFLFPVGVGLTFPAVGQPPLCDFFFFFLKKKMSSYRAI